MSSLARAVSNPCSSITFNYAKSVHALAQRTSLAEVPTTAPEGATREHRMPTQPEMVTWRFVKHPAAFQLHPERLKQIIHEKDGQIFCNYLSKEGQRKRKRCLMIMEKRKKLMQATGMGPYIVRNMSLVHKPNQPSSYTSYINSKLPTNHRGNYSTSSRRSEGQTLETESLESLELPKSKSKEMFLNTSAKENLAKAGAKTKKKKRNLKPLQAFKRTTHLSESCEMNLPPVAETGATNDWVTFSDSANDSDVVVVVKNNSKVYQVCADQKCNVSCSARITDESIPDGGFIDNIFTLFDKVKLDSKKHLPKGPADNIPFKNGMKTLSSDPKDVYKIISSTLKRKEMHLKRQLSQICVQQTEKTAIRTRSKERILKSEVQNFEKCSKK